MKRGREKPTFEALGLNPLVMAKFGYGDLEVFLEEQERISPEQMKFLRICTQ